MSQAVYAVYGASGFGREVLPLAQHQLNALGVQMSRLVFVDDNTKLTVLNGHPVLSYSDFLNIDAIERFAVLAIGSGVAREKVASRMKADGVRPWSVHASNNVTMGQVTLGEGAVVLPFVTFTSDIRIGRYFQAGIYAYVAHECVVGDFVTFGPRASCNGNVVIEDHAYIGTGAILRQGRLGQPLVIGKGAVVGMGAIVTKDVPAGTTVVGNPARPLIKS